jgi:tetratricopeptide (TPR) repeat protein
VDFPPECAAYYPQDFRYPIGYLVRPERVTDVEILTGFDEWQRPYVIHWRDECILDPGAPVAARRLARGKPDTSIISAIRAIEWGNSSNPSLQESFSVEDSLAEAALWSEVGLHEYAIAMIQTVPVPHQKTRVPLEALANSFKALGRYDKALKEVEMLIHVDSITEYARNLYRIEKAELLLHLNRRQESESLLDQHRMILKEHWQYYGMRAALALADGKQDLARSLVHKAGRADGYHAYKLLWNRHLAPLADFIRSEFLTDDNKPHLYELNTKTLRLCHSIHGALLAGRHREAANLGEGLMFVHVNNWCCAEALALAWTGLSEWEYLAAVLPTLAGRKMDSIKLAQAFANWRIHGDKDSLDEVREKALEAPFSESARQEFEMWLDWQADGKTGETPHCSEMIVADVAPKNWGSGDGRDHWVLFYKQTCGFRLQRFWQDRSRHRPLGWEMREHFPLQEETIFNGHDEIQQWLETKLVENHNARDTFTHCVWTIDWNGWAIPRILAPDPHAHPFLFETYQLACDDPSFYFHNGPAYSFGSHLPFGDKLLAMLRAQ